MTISRVNGAAWAVGEKLTSAQANGLDLNGTYALDKRVSQTDTLQSIVSCSGAGRIVVVRMRPLSLAERGSGSTAVSLGELLRGERPTIHGSTETSLTDYADEIANRVPKCRPGATD